MSDSRFTYQHMTDRELALLDDDEDERVPSEPIPDEGASASLQ